MATPPAVTRKPASNPGAGPAKGAPGAAGTPMDLTLDRALPPDETARSAARKSGDAAQGMAPIAAPWRLPAGASRRDDSLLDALVVLTAIFERPHTAEALTAGLPLVNDRLTPDLFVRAAARADLSARIVKRSLADISDLSLPAVLLLVDSTACVLVGLRDTTTAEVIMPESGHGISEVPLEHLDARYTGFAIFTRPEFQFDSRSEATEIKPTRSWFWGTLARFWRIYAQVAVAALFINLFALATPLFIMNVYDRVVPTRAQETLWVLVLGVLTIFVFEFILRNLRAYFVDTAGRSADVIMASKIFQQILSIKMAARPASAGAFANQLREFETLRDFFTSATLVALVDLPFIVLFVGAVFMIGGPVGFVPLIAVPMVIGAGMLLQVPLTNIVAATARESAQKHALLVESIVGLETIKSLGAEGRTQRNWERFVGMTAKSSMKARSLSQLAMFLTALTTQLTTVAVVVVGVFLIFEGDLTVGALIACTILTGRAMAQLSQLAGVLTRFNQSRVSLRTLDTIMKLPTERPNGKQFVHRPNLRGAIEFRDVSFAYPNQDVMVVQNATFAIKPGERIGIIGKIGSGKSTVEKLILGLHEPTEGSIRLDGTDIKQIDPADLRRSIGYVAQDVFLFYGSVRDNIAMGAPYVDDAAILRAAHISGVDSFISKHPHGFDLQVGERGENLSGGQRQAIAIARALVRDPSVLMMDEPTSAMDKGSEDWFISRLEETLEGRTLIIVTQRVSLLTLVDRLIVMDGGRIVADGPRDSVIETLASGQIRGAAD
jgi:ATP-binding cassette subfamily C protein LapB